jgi:hypothetical protein
MKYLRKKILFLLLAVFSVIAANAQVTTSGINGQITDAKSEPLPGANVIAVHVPSGTTYSGVSDIKGWFRIPNMTAGGPYKITITFVGYESKEFNDIYLSLGQTFKIDTKLSEGAVALNEVVVTGKHYNPIDGNRTGAETMVGLQSIQSIPSVGRSLTDFTRLTPQASVNSLGGISVAGINNRYNSLSIDGAVNNDVYGLSNQGTNGGQTGGTPISIDAIEQFQVALAPYDVRQNGFAGASINAVTKRGTNNVHGSAYWITRNQDMAGKTPGKMNVSNRTKLPDFSSNIYGMTVGGPIIKDKLFYFVSAEMQRDETPKPFDISTYQGTSTSADLDAFATYLKTKYNYDPGIYANQKAKLNSDKLLARVDWNISNVHKLTLRHSYVNNVSYTPSASSKTAINFSNNGIKFPSVTNSSAAELNSNWTGYSNKLILGYTSVRDNRNPMGTDFPSLTIYDGSKGTIYAGSEPYSTANQLNQDVVTLTDNFNLYLGKHTLTLGADVEYAKSYNLFVRQTYGAYTYNSLSDFMNNKPVAKYDHSYSLVDNIAGDGSAAAAKFKSMQYALYAQDEYQVSNNFKLTYGLRADMQVFPDNPKTIAQFDTTLNKITAAGYDLKGAQSGKMPKAQILLSPRVGFNWDVMDDNEWQVRGGLGIFTSRLPLVWPGGVYTNCGLIVGTVSQKNPILSSTGAAMTFNPDPNNQYQATDIKGYSLKVPSGEVNLFSKDFKYPQVFRANLAVDKKLPYGIVATVEGMYTKTINDVLYKNVNLANDAFQLTGSPDNRLHYGYKRIENTYSAIYLAENTTKGYSYNFTFQLQKPFENGLTAMAAYTLGHSKAMNDNTSSQNSSQWRYMESVNGRNNLDLSYSDFDLGSRVVAFLSYKIEYLNHAATTISLFYNGQSGSRFSWVYGNKGNVSGTTNYIINDDNSSNELIFVPKDASQINLIPYTLNGVTVTADQQWKDLEDFINSDKYLKSRKGKYAERNGDRLPFVNTLDLKLTQDFFVNVNGVKHNLQLGLDIFNFGNLLNKNWGTRYYLSNDNYSILTYEGLVADANNGGQKTKPSFTFIKPSGDFKSISDSGISSSRWQAQFTVRYSF